MNATIKKLRKNRPVVTHAAFELDVEGKRVNGITVYHRIKSKLKLPPFYDFDLGAEIMRILKSAGWNILP